MWGGGGPPPPGPYNPYGPFGPFGYPYAPQVHHGGHQQDLTPDDYTAWHDSMHPAAMFAQQQALRNFEAARTAQHISAFAPINALTQVLEPSTVDDISRASPAAETVKFSKDTSTYHKQLISMAEIAIDEDYMHNQTKCIPKIGDRLQKAYPKDFPSAPSDWLIKSKLKEMTDPYKAVDGKFMDTRQKDTGCLPVSEHASELQRLSIAL
jgi:hypothetical protein